MGHGAFDDDVTRVFDDMLERSIPQYGLMRHSVLDVGQQFVQPGTAIVDLGCSRGGAMAPFVEVFGDANRYLGVETSEPMRAAATARFADAIRRGLMEIRDLDLRLDYPRVPASLTLAVLVLQFVPLEYRQRVVRSAYRNTVPGGALVVVEKVLGSDADLDELFRGALPADETGAWLYTGGNQPEATESRRPARAGHCSLERGYAVARRLPTVWTASGDG